MQTLKSSTANNRRTYIPPGVERMISQQMEHSLPAHLKKYVGSGQPAYIPASVQKEITKAYEKKLPGHMKEYAGAYVQQNIVDPSFRKELPTTSGVVNVPHQATAPPSHNYTPKQATMPEDIGTEGAVQDNQIEGSRDEALPATLQSPQQGQAPDLQSPNPDYNFIFNDQKPKRRFGFSLPGGGNLGKFTVLIIGGVIVVGILTIVLSSLFGPKVNTKGLVDLVARAQEISRVSSNVTDQSRDLNTQNLASTVSNTMDSQERQIINYLKSNKKTVNAKDVAVYQSKTTDTEVQTAQQNNRLSEYYYSYLKKNLMDYETALKAATGGAGPKLKSDLDSFSASNQMILSTSQLATATP